MAKTKAQDALNSLTHNFLDFLNFLSRKSKSDNIDQFFRKGSITTTSELFEIGKYFLEHTIGIEENDFFPSLGYKEFACFVPQSETYYPWALFVVPTSIEDLAEFFDHHGRNYLLSANSGKKDYIVVTNSKSLSVFDFTHYDSRFEVSYTDLYDSTVQNNPNASLKNWENFLKEFGPDKVKEKKKNRRKEVIDYQRPKESSPELQYVKRFGHMPSFEIPIGYDNNNYRETFKTKESLPFLTTETIDWDGTTKKVENRLIWGDNLAVMRSLPSESIDLIYIDPPFFSGRNYNCIFGDDDEIRSFKDIWDGGLPTYLAWLNARLWEMKRLLKTSGSIFIHLDWHAAQYVKCELDKIFGYDNFINEIIWGYDVGGKSKRHFARKHDNIFWYSKAKDYFFDSKAVRVPMKSGEKSFGGRLETDADGRKYRLVYGTKDKNGNAKYYKYYLDEGKIPEDYWTDINSLQSKVTERIGYPTQKPEELLKRIISCASPEKGVVADFFSGGGTTVSVAEKLGRNWIGTDISRIAVSVARDRLLTIYDKPAGIQPLNKAPKHSFKVDYHGVYERDLVRELETESYNDFVLKCYQAIPKKIGTTIHGFKDNKAVFVAPAKSNLKSHHIDEFCADLAEKKIQNGIILAWNISKEAEKYVSDLRKGSSGVDIQIIQIKLVDIDSNEFKGDNIRFINKPVALIRAKQKSELTWVFDASASCGSNGSDIHYYQWDFNHKNKFTPSTKPKFKGSEDVDGDGNPLNDYKKIEYTFPSEGEFNVALRVFDKSGAEAITNIKVIISKKGSKVA